MGVFPNRYRRCTPPNYPDLTLSVLANPTGALYQTLLFGDASTPESTSEIGAALVQAYAGAKVDAYGMTFDFSTADAAMATIGNDALPFDLRVWLRNAPNDLVAYERDEATKNFHRSLTIGN